MGACHRPLQADGFPACPLAPGSLQHPLDEEHDLLATCDDEPTQARRDVGALLEELPEKQRLPILHVKLEGLSVAETAQLTGMSESAVKVGIHRGLKALALKIREKLQA